MPYLWSWVRKWNLFSWRKVVELKMIQIENLNCKKILLSLAKQE